MITLIHKYKQTETKDFSTLSSLIFCPGAMVHAVCITVVSPWWCLCLCLSDIAWTHSCKRHNDDDSRHELCLRHVFPVETCSVLMLKCLSSNALVCLVYVLISVAWHRTTASVCVSVCRCVCAAVDAGFEATRA